MKLLRTLTIVSRCRWPRPPTRPDRRGAPTEEEGRRRAAATLRPRARLRPTPPRVGTRRRQPAEPGSIARSVRVRRRRQPVGLARLRSSSMSAVHRRVAGALDELIGTSSFACAELLELVVATCRRRSRACTSCCACGSVDPPGTVIDWMASFTTAFSLGLARAGAEQPDRGRRNEGGDRLAAGLHRSGRLTAPSRFVRSLEDSLGSRSRIARSLDDGARAEYLRTRSTVSKRGGPSRGSSACRSGDDTAVLGAMLAIFAISV